MRMWVLPLTGLVSVLLVHGPALAQGKAGAQLRGFSVVLVEGSQQQGGSVDLPPAARAALDDVKDFLPFRSYRLLDSSWTLGSNAPREYSIRLRGGSQDYQVRLGSSVADASSQVQIRFTLTDATTDSLWSRVAALPAPRPAAATSAQVDLVREETNLAALEKKLSALSQTLAPDHPEVRSLQEDVAQTRRRIEELQLAVAVQAGVVPRRRVVTGPAGSLIETSFTMRVGETVVVGTSRVGGDKALIALLTAVPSSTKP